MLWLYGGIGLVMALAGWIIFRDTPEEHPNTNSAEQDIILAGRQPIESSTRLPLAQLVTHRGLWSLNLCSIGINFGWAFLITWLPTYLTDVYHLGPVQAGRYVTIALGVGMAGLAFGGWFTDAATRRLGLRWGRRLPFLLGGSIAATAYLMCLRIHTSQGIAAACAVVAFATDSTTSAVWAIGQDIGGRHTAATMAWSNMWGNLGASAVAKILPWVYEVHHDWQPVFLVLAGGFVFTTLARFTRQHSDAASNSHADPT